MGAGGTGFVGAVTEAVFGIRSAGDVIFTSTDIARMRITSGGEIRSVNDSFHNSTGGATNIIAGDLPYALYRRTNVLNVNDTTDTLVAWDSEVIDRGGDFASNTFIAPVAGLYQLSGVVKFHDHSGSNTTGRFQIVTSNRTYEIEFDPANHISGAGPGSI